MKSKFLEIARDPRVIPGVHHYCDEWCKRCSLTERCLAFRCTSVYRKLRNRQADEPTFLDLAEGIAFTRELSAVEGVPTPELDRIAGGKGAHISLRTTDPLANIAWEYALAVSMWLVLTPEELRRLRMRPEAEPEEIVLWYHLRIYMKLTRALVADEQKPVGSDHRREDVNGCAKLTLVSIERSRKALTRLKTTAHEKTVVSLLSLLKTLEQGIDERFPHARTYVRVGLDVPA